jgi:hypothetical protein
MKRLALNIAVGAAVLALVAAFVYALNNSEQRKRQAYRSALNQCLDAKYPDVRHYPEADRWMCVRRVNGSTDMLEVKPQP